MRSKSNRFVAEKPTTDMGIGPGAYDHEQLNNGQRASIRGRVADSITTGMSAAFRSDSVREIEFGWAAGRATTLQGPRSSNIRFLFVSMLMVFVTLHSFCDDGSACMLLHQGRVEIVSQSQRLCSGAHWEAAHTRDTEKATQEPSRVELLFDLQFEIVVSLG
jgi:hypothetical protein